VGRGEFAFIDWIRQHALVGGAGVSVGPGDDCAVIDVSGGRILLTTDILLDGTHFDLAAAGPVLVGRKAVAANLSDIAAMAGLPRAAVVAVGLPRSAGQALARALYRGMREVADAYECPIVGGDVTAWPRSADRLVISVAVVGEPAEIEPVLRSGAQVGDEVLVTGRLGGASLGRHLTFEPLIAEARALATAGSIHAMIDLSDGLSSDLAHIAAESETGAVIRAGDVPVHPDAETLARSSGRPPLEHALNDGEDFELLFTTDRRTADRLCADPPAAVALTRIGEIVPEGFFIEAPDGQRMPLVSAGYEHEL